MHFHLSHEIDTQFWKLYKSSHYESTLKYFSGQSASTIVQTKSKIIESTAITNRKFHYNFLLIYKEPSENRNAKVRKIDYQLSRILSESTVTIRSSFTSVEIKKQGEIQSHSERNRTSMQQN